ncbi:hypothetical protein F183_A10970 [Bryobacterales bacterium F-183]|nr:hypothetical protein F183_A10970 [Bryobacterales bacterium F-183]
MDFGDSERFHEDFHSNHKIEPGGHLSIDNHNGHIEISTWEKDEIEINGTKHASTKELLEDLKVDVDATPTKVAIRISKPEFMTGGAGVRLNLRVPKKLELDRIRSTNGHIRVNGTEGPATLETTNGKIGAEKMNGKLIARTTNGGISIEGHAGSVRANTTNGSIQGEMRGALEAETSNGSIDMKVDNAGSTSPVRLETSNGKIHVVMTSAAELRARTNNSSITVELPAATDANIRAKTSNSRVHSDFGPDPSWDDEDGDNRRRSMDMKIGKGGPVIDLSTSNGDIRILKR